MKAYKGFNKDMTCRDFQYEEGKEYTTDEARLCNSGFHACEYPLDCFGYYAPGESVYHEVDLDDVSDERENDTKVCAKKIKIGAALDVKGLIKAAFEYTSERCTNHDMGGDWSALTGGNKSALTGGNMSALTGGDWSALRGGENSRFRGGKWTVFACEVWKNFELVDVITAVVDGKKIKADTWYEVKGGKFVEVENE